MLSVRICWRRCSSPLRHFLPPASVCLKTIFAYLQRWRNLAVRILPCRFRLHLCEGTTKTIVDVANQYVAPFNQLTLICGYHSAWNILRITSWTLLSIVKEASTLVSPTFIAERKNHTMAWNSFGPPCNVPLAQGSPGYAPTNDTTVYITFEWDKCH